MEEAVSSLTRIARDLLHEIKTSTDFTQIHLNRVIQVCIWYAGMHLICRYAFDMELLPQTFNGLKNVISRVIDLCWFLDVYIVNMLSYLTIFANDITI